MNEMEKRSFKAFEMWCWRQNGKNNWAERITNKVVLTQVRGTRSILNVIKRNKCTEVKLRILCYSHQNCVNYKILVFFLFIFFCTVLCNRFYQNNLT
jgi:hypothetical protein